MNAVGKYAKRVLASIGVAALGVTAVAAGASADPGPGQPSAPSTGSLTIHKLIGAEGEAGDGTVQDVDGDELEDVQFTIWQLGLPNDDDECVALDLSDADAWNSVPAGTAPATLAAVEAAGFCVVGTPTVDTTDENGELTFSGLALGLYYVQETDAPADVVSRTAPFYVSIPLPHEEQGWLYQVHVYPKNQIVDEPVKTINSDADQPGNGLVVGSVVEWTITQSVPALNAGEEYTSASIWDVLPASLGYVATLDVTLNGAALEETDYEIDPDGVTWTLTDDGLGKLAEGDELKIVFTTKVLVVTETGEIGNPGSDGETPGYGSEFNGTKIPGGPTPYTYWGQLSILKNDDSTPVQALANAEFKVFDTATDGTCPTAAPTSGEIATGVSDATGVVQWSGVTPTSPLGLWIANSSDGPLTDPTKAYCVYETVVPVGHTAVAFSALQTIEPGSDNVLELTVVNAKKEGPELPLTGAQGTLLMTIGGLALVGVGGGALLVSRRRRNDAA